MPIVRVNLVFALCRYDWFGIPMSMGEYKISPYDCDVKSNGDSETDSSFVGQIVPVSD